VQNQEGNSRLLFCASSIQNVSQLFFVAVVGGISTNLSPIPESKHYCNILH